jgi:hypothetical protein
VYASGKHYRPSLLFLERTTRTKSLRVRSIMLFYRKNAANFKMDFKEDSETNALAYSLLASVSNEKVFEASATGLWNTFATDNRCCTITKNGKKEMFFFAGKWWMKTSGAYIIQLFFHNLQIIAISYSVCHWQAFQA